jgi:hypothetical protein
VARKGLRWINVASLSLAASCFLGPVGCSDEDEPDPGPDASIDTRRDTGTDTSVRTDVSPDVSPDRGAADAGAREAGADAGAREAGADAGAREAGADAGTPDSGCVGGGDAARDGVLGRAAVEAFRCANCHQEEPPDAGLILSGRAAGDSGNYPRNLTPDPMTGLGCWTDQQIINAFMDGVGAGGRMLCPTRMPRFATRGMDAGTAQEIVDFLRTLPAVQKAIPATTNCPPPPEPQPEAGTDADGGTHTDAPDVAPDAGPDVAPPDAAPDTAPDAGPDNAPEAGPDDAAPDGGIDAEIDVADGGSIDVDIDAGD